MLAQKRSALAGLVHQYTTTLSRDAGSPMLKGLARQIATAAEELGQIVALPQAPSRSGMLAAMPLPAPSTGHVDLQT